METSTLDATGSRRIRIASYARILMAAFFASAPAVAAEEAGGNDAAELAKKLQNPVASLVSVPIQGNYDFGAGAGDDGFQFKANVQPVIPISLTDRWNLISRTILPVITQDDVINTHSQTGLGDTTQSFFVSPQDPTSFGLVWGVGPAFVFPTATNHSLGAEKWGAGPTMVLLTQSNGWTTGILANHIWSFAGAEGRRDFSATYLQPFLSYTTAAHTTFALNTETSYEWKGEDWTVPINFTVAQLVKAGGLPLQLQVGVRYYAERPSGGPDWGLRTAITFLFPR